MDPKLTYERLHELQILDVREPFEWEMGHIEGAQHIPMGEIASRLDDIAHDKSLVAVCRSGSRSAEVTGMLRDKGFEIENLDGGLKAWAEAGLPVVSSKGEAGRVV